MPYTSLLQHLKVSLPMSRTALCMGLQLWLHVPKPCTDGLYSNCRQAFVQQNSNCLWIQRTIMVAGPCEHKRPQYTPGAASITCSHDTCRPPGLLRCAVLCSGSSKQLPQLAVDNRPRAHHIQHCFFQPLITNKAGAVTGSQDPLTALLHATQAAEQSTSAKHIAALATPHAKV